MGKTIVINPVTRIEGHLAVKTEIADGRVTAAFVTGEMFRGFETILRGRNPLDAQQITQRICGVCPIEHGIASIQAQEMIYGVRPPDNGRILRNIIQGANFIASHITHFYLLSALDFVDIGAISSYTGKDSEMVAFRDWVQSQVESRSVLPAAPFLPRYVGDYLQDKDLNCAAIRHYLDALEMRRLAQQMGALFSGKMPHAPALVPGGVTEHATAQNITAGQALLEKLRVFIDQAYLPDVLAVAKGFPGYFTAGKSCGNFLAYGVFPESADSQDPFLPGGVLTGGTLKAFNPNGVTEDTASSRFSSPSGLKPGNGETIAAPDKPNAYTWLKAPRYEGQVMEVGPLARLLVGYANGRNPLIKSTADSLLAAIGKTPADLPSVMGRHAARAVECKLIADRCAVWFDQLVPNKPSFADFQIAESGSGVGLTEAARGALGHWLEISGHKVRNYQCVVPTTWNCSPRDDRGTPGAVEQALVGTPVADVNNPIEVARVIRSFDPCLACAVH
jgi:ferredoxin hydrogenase large subunit/hydrogenase large subunit